MFITKTAVRGEFVVRDGLAAVSRKLRREDGASAIEYALLVGLIAVVIIAAVSFLGQGVKDKLSDAGNALT